MVHLVEESGEILAAPKLPSARDLTEDAWNHGPATRTAGHLGITDMLKRLAEVSGRYAERKVATPNFLLGVIMSMNSWRLRYYTRAYIRNTLVNSIIVSTVFPAVRTLMVP